MTIYFRLRYVYLTSSQETAVKWEDHWVTGDEECLKLLVSKRLKTLKDIELINITKHSVKIMSEEEYYSDNTW